MTHSFLQHLLGTYRGQVLASWTFLILVEGDGQLSDGKSKGNQQAMCVSKRGTLSALGRSGLTKREHLTKTRGRCWGPGREQLVPGVMDGGAPDSEARVGCPQGGCWEAAGMCG